MVIFLNILILFLNQKNISTKNSVYLIGDVYENELKLHKNHFFLKKEDFYFFNNLKLHEIYCIFDFTFHFIIFLYENNNSRNL